MVPTPRPVPSDGAIRFRTTEQGSFSRVRVNSFDVDQNFTVIFCAVNGG